MALGARVEDEEDLRLLIPAPADGVDGKKVPRLDDLSAAFIAKCTLVGLGVRRADGKVDVAIRGGAPGFAGVEDGALLIDDAPAARFGDVTEAVAASGSAGAVVMVPGIGDVLRVNGTAGAADGRIAIAPDEVYGHCPKAVTRSKLWSRPSTAPLPELPVMAAGVPTDLRSGVARRVLAAAPFAFLATCSAAGDADTSPRGDPPGFLRPVGRDTVLLPDRPGNKIVDSFRNVLEQPHAALLVLVPGTSAVLRLRGRASLTRDVELLADSAVKGRAPELGLLLEVEEAEVGLAPAVVAARLWSEDRHVARGEVPSLAKLLVAHIAANGTALEEREIEAEIREDLRDNLY